MGMKTRSTRKRRKLGRVTRAILDALEGLGESDVYDLANEIDHEPQPVYQIVNRLRKDKLVVRTDGHTGAGRNPAVFALTAKGTKVLEKDRAAAMA